MENQKKERTVVRRLFTRTANELETLLTDYKDLSNISTTFLKVKELAESLIKFDNEIKAILLQDEKSTDDDLEKELSGALEYKTKWLHLDAVYKLKQVQSAGSSSSTSGEVKQRSFKLPKLQLQTFDGQLKNWLPFWSQFSKIHEDKTLDDTEKFQYLCQAMKPESEPRTLVEGFPATAYQQCVDQLTGRYARKELLIQIYIRELLTLVLLEKKESLTKLYDRLTAHLRALETLKVTTENYAAFLLPMVESALPNETLLIWERNRDPGKEVAEELKNLLTFLRKEVEGEQRLEISRKTFNSHQEEKPLLTAECLVSNVKPKKGNSMQHKCIWCEKDTHCSIECYKISKLDLEQRKSLIKEKKCCSICLRMGHHPKVCRASVRCLICAKRHSTVLCPDQKVERKEDRELSTLASTDQKGETLLQTVIVEVEVDGEKRKMRALLDSGSQRTYIKKDIVGKMKLQPARREVLTHILFGGVETKSKEFEIYNVTVNSLNDSFKLELSAICQNNICGNIPKVDSNDIQLNKMLNANKIALTDRDSDIKEIGLLIGSDFLGFLLTGSIVQLKDGLVAVKTKLGWTLQRKQVSVNFNRPTNVLAQCVCESDLTEYWRLETLGIRDPIDVKTKAENEAEVMMSFEEHVKVNTEGRYEVQLPWKVGFDQLLNNFNIAKQRLESTTKKLLISDKFDTYHDIIQEWCDKGIIEPVSKPEMNMDQSHYLPHKAVLKESSLTTEVRPVFDTSARDRNGKSLNSCLEKGI